MNYVKEFLKFLIEFLKEQGISPLDVLKAFFSHKGLHANAQVETVDLLREYGFDVQHPSEFPEGVVRLGSKDVVAPDQLHPTTEIKAGAKPKDEDGNRLESLEKSTPEPVKSDPAPAAPVPHK